MIFVSVGTNEARFDRLVEAVAILPFEEDLLIQHGHSRRIERPGAELVDFLAFDGMVDAIRAARIVVTHAGVGSVMLSVANGKRPLVVPRRKTFGEAVDDHQLQLGRRFAHANLVTLVQDPAELATVVASAHEAAELIPSASRLAADLSGYLEQLIPSRTPRA